MELLLSTSVTYICDQHGIRVRVNNTELYYILLDGDNLLSRKEVRCNGIGQKMGAAFLPLARDLGYSASFFNLVFVSNEVR